MQYFGHNGRRLPSSEMRVFGESESNYYNLLQPDINFQEIYRRSVNFGVLTNDIGVEVFQLKAEASWNNIKNDARYKNLLNGVHVPFVTDLYSIGEDLGVNLENRLLPCVQRSFNDMFPEAHFKAILQSDSKLQNRVIINKYSNYDLVLDKILSEPLIGWYFPQALKEFDIRSQREQMSEMKDCSEFNICLSGGIDVCAALVGTPGLLINDATYAPILCMSAYEHQDPRLALLIKSYGPHMEFWCMTQMLTSGITQVSEQWSGGLSILS